MIFSPSIIRGSLTATLLGGLFVIRFCCHALNAQEPGPAERSLSFPASAPPETVYIQTSKDIFPTRGEASLKITVKDENGRPVRANLGVSVFGEHYRNRFDPSNILAHYFPATHRGNPSTSRF
jgi:hypothetical protein